MEKRSHYFLKPLKTFRDVRVILLLCRTRTPYLIRCYCVAMSEEDLPNASFEIEGKALKTTDAPHRSVPAVRLDPPPPERMVVFEYLEGVSFSEISRKKLPTFSWEMWFDQIAQSLAWLSHIAGAPIMHGDIAPGNVMLLSDDRPVLVDFSSARLLDGACPTPPTMFSGTVSYAAPECLTAAPCPESDLFSLAMTFLSVMSGVPGKRLTDKRIRRELRRIESPFQEKLFGCLSPDPKVRRKSVAASWTSLVYGAPIATRQDVHIAPVAALSSEQRSESTELTYRDTSIAATTTAVEDNERSQVPPIPSECRTNVRDETLPHTDALERCPFEVSTCPFLKAASALLSDKEISVLQ